MTGTARLISGTGVPVTVELVRDGAAVLADVALMRTGAPGDQDGRYVYYVQGVTGAPMTLKDDGTGLEPEPSHPVPRYVNDWTPPAHRVPLTYFVKVWPAQGAEYDVPVTGTPVTLATWPEPRLTLSADVDPVGHQKVVFHVAGGKGTPAVISPGDGHRTLTVPLTDGVGSVEYEYLDAGHHTYTATVACPMPVLYPTWTALQGANTTWSQVPASVATWGDATAGQETAQTSVTVDVGDATVFAHIVTGPGGIPFIAVDVWIGLPTETVVSWEITRRVSATSFPDYPIWLESRSPSGGSIEDHEAPLWSSVDYILTVNLSDDTARQYTSNVVSIQTVTGCLLTAVDTGHTVRVTLQSWDEQTNEARAVRLAVSGRADPVVISDVRIWAKGTWVLRTHTWDELLALRQILESPVVLLRTQPASAIETMYVAPGDVTEARLFTGDGSSWVRQHQIPVQRVAPPSPTARASSVRWADVEANWTSWASLAADVPTWADLRAWRP